MNKNFCYEIDYSQRVLHVRLVVLDREVEPLIVPQRVSVILYQQDVFLIFLIFVHAMQITTLEPGIETQ